MGTYSIGEVKTMVIGPKNDEVFENTRTQKASKLSSKNSIVLAHLSSGKVVPCPNFKCISNDLLQDIATRTSRAKAADLMNSKVLCEMVQADDSAGTNREARVDIACNPSNNIFKETAYASDERTFAASGSRSHSQSFLNTLTSAHGQTQAIAMASIASVALLATGLTLILTRQLTRKRKNQ